MKLGPILLSKYLPHLFLHSSVNGHSDSLHSFAMVEHAAINLKMLGRHGLCIFCALWLHTKECNCCILGMFNFPFMEEPPYPFPEWLQQPACPPTGQEGSV